MKARARARVRVRAKGEGARVRASTADSVRRARGAVLGGHLLLHEAVPRA